MPEQIIIASWRMKALDLAREKLLLQADGSKWEWIKNSFVPYTAFRNEPLICGVHGRLVRRTKADEIATHWTFELRWDRDEIKGAHIDLDLMNHPSRGGKASKETYAFRTGSMSNPEPMMCIATLTRNLKQDGEYRTMWSFIDPERLKEMDEEALQEQLRRGGEADEPGSATLTSSQQEQQARDERRRVVNERRHLEGIERNRR